MPLESQRFQHLLNDFKLGQLFNEIGWDRVPTSTYTVEIDDERFALTPIAQKRGITIFQCAPNKEGAVPPRPTLLKIEREVQKLAHEHLLIFGNQERSVQTWLWVSRSPGEPAAVRMHTWHKGTSGESLRQKLKHIAFTLTEEESITLTLALQRLRDGFDRDRVTKRFYERFAAEHGAFSQFITGITDLATQQWYASLMLNRLMFVYFIQKKGFLDRNVNYLGERLGRVQAQVGKGKFHSFYRQFLKRLFHEGLGQSRPRGAALDALLGDIPYLNGGLFDVHELEEAHTDIDIPDEAFERLFKFFDGYDWHLDDRPLSSGSEINPDVLGYIFEKYINQKQMGAYYTKEDITGYIARNTVIPCLLERAKARCKVAFEGKDSVWALLVADPDRYLYPAMRRGVIGKAGQIIPESELPDFVQVGIHDPKARMFDRRYNLGAAQFTTLDGDSGTLPTETWREYVERRRRCLEIRQKMLAGELGTVDDLITYNVDIRQFMQDVVEQHAGAELLRAIWQAIVGCVPDRSSASYLHGLSILDPTCGSGAFLFAALNVMEPLYEACIERMEDFANIPAPVGDRVVRSEGSFTDFRRVLDEVSQHPSRRYYIYKSIVVHNLYGVDIMAEAVEICKLRLFLKLVSQVENVSQLEPLPDIDFNIRIGNTLVGYVTAEQLQANTNLASDRKKLPEIEARAADLSVAFDLFRTQQTVHGGKISGQSKRGLRERLAKLCFQLDRFLAVEYGVDPDKTRKFSEWRASHQPFHWFAEFYSVMREGGFGVVFGNPPYIQLSDVTSYTLLGYDCAECGNLYPIMLERCLSIVRTDGRQGYIVPVSSISTDGYQTLQSKYRPYRVHVSCYDDRPSRLFDGLEHIRLVIFLLCKGATSEWRSTRYHKWNGAERAHLFERLTYTGANEKLIENSIAKLTSEIEHSVLKKLSAVRRSLGTAVVRNGPHTVNFSRKVGYFLQVVDFQPRVVDGRGKLRPPSEFKPLAFASEAERNAASAVLNSNLFYWFITVFSDCRHLNKREIDAMAFPDDLHKQTPLIEELQVLTHKLMLNLRKTSDTRRMKFKHDTLEIECLIPKQSKAIIDSIDLALASPFGFTVEESDFLINYDIKYRIGDADNED